MTNWEAAGNEVCGTYSNFIQKKFAKGIFIAETVEKFLSSIAWCFK